MKLNDITVLLLLYNTSRSVLKNLKYYKNFKVLILDQSNDNEIKKDIMKILPNIQFYKLTNKNNGFAWGINYLSKKVKTKFFLCTQPDVAISKNDILKLKKPFFKKKDTIISIPFINTFKNFDFKKKKKNSLIKVNKMIGAIFLCNKVKFDKIGKFDENFFFYWEDMDLSRKIDKSKFSIYLNFESKANHLGGKSTTQEYKNLFIKNLNFKFGEYFYQYKYNELKLIKVIREIITIPLLFLIFIVLLRFNSAFKLFCYYLGVLKFYFYLLFKI